MDLQRIFDYVDQQKDSFIAELKKWISVKSVSSLPECRPECIEIIHLVAGELKDIGCTVSVEKNPKVEQKFSDGNSVELPPVLLATYGSDTSKKTLCIYGHLDVQPARKDDGWNTDPFELHIEGDAMYGRGATDDKGPVLAWVILLRAMKALSIEPDVNMKFVIECMEESGSIGLDELVTSLNDRFLKDVDCICVTDCFGLGLERPCVIYGLRGLSYFHLEVQGPAQDLHSGVYGGTVHEPMTDLVYLMSKLVDPTGKILVPGIYDQVAPTTDEESQLYEKIDFEVAKYALEIGCTTESLLHTTKKDCLMYKWRFPSLSLHGIEGAFSEAGGKTVIPRKVIGKFSIRSVPNMDVDKTYTLVNDYIKKLAQEAKLPYPVNLIQAHAAPAWVGDIKHPNYVAACKGAKIAYGIEPDLIREGASVPITLTFANITGKNALILPLGRSDDGAHSQNEKFNISNFLKGIKWFAAYLKELAVQT